MFMWPRYIASVSNNLHIELLAGRIALQNLSKERSEGRFSFVI